LRLKVSPPSRRAERNFDFLWALFDPKIIWEENLGE
jgi:hypothetical protein